MKKRTKAQIAADLAAAEEELKLKAEPVGRREWKGDVDQMFPDSTPREVTWSVGTVSQIELNEKAIAAKEKENAEK